MSGDTVGKKVFMNYNFGTAVFHSENKEELEWLRERLVWSQGFCTTSELATEAEKAQSYLYRLVEFFDWQNEVDTNYIDHRGFIYQIGDVGENDNRPGDYFFTVSTQTAWNFCYEFFDLIQTKLGIPYASFDESEDGDVGITGDPDGIYFPENFAFDSWNEVESKAFVKEEELLEYLNKNFPALIPVNPTLDEWDEALRDADEGAVRIYGREGVNEYAHAA